MMRRVFLRVVQTLCVVCTVPFSNLAYADSGVNSNTVQDRLLACTSDWRGNADGVATAYEAQSLTQLLEKNRLRTTWRHEPVQIQHERQAILARAKSIKNNTFTLNA